MKLITVLFTITVLASCQSFSNDKYHLTRVQDGDSVILCCDRNHDTFIVRLKDIDAPEKNQPFAKSSKSYLNSLIENKPLTLVGNKKDRYGRLLADIVINDKSINTKMIKTGHAWVWRYSNNQRLQSLQKQAQKQKKGLWALPESQRIEPWQWRKNNRRNR